MRWENKAPFDCIVSQ